MRIGAFVLALSAVLAPNPPDVLLMNRIGPSSSELFVADAPGNDAHAVWTEDGRSLIWSSSRNGFKDEAVLYDNNPQPYASLFMMGLDGGSVRQLTDSPWEDGMPRFVPRKSQAP